MKVFAFILLIPLTALADHPTCQELQGHASALENEVKAQAVKECGNFDLTKMVSGEIGSEDIQWFNEIKCGRFSAVEAEIDKLENQLSLLKGFEYLKDEIKNQKQQVAEKRTGPVAEAAGRKFTQALNSAHTLEQFLNLPDAITPLAHLKSAAVEERDTPEKFQQKLKDICKELKIKKGPCQADFRLSESAVRDINALLEQPFHKDPSMLDQWKASLEITRADGTEYSFQEMAQDFAGYTEALETKGTLSRDQLRAITTLPDFKNAPKGMEFLKNIHAKDVPTEVIATSKFKFLVEDLKYRQRMEVMSKLSATVHEFGPNMNAEQQAACSDFHPSAIASAPQCLEQLKEVQKQMGTGEKQSHLAQMISLMEPALAYHEKLEKVEKECVQAGKANCEDQFNLDMGTVSQRLQALKAVRSKIVEENEQKMAFREFALYKWKELCEEGKYASVIDHCAEATSQISTEIIVLTDSVTKIAMSYVPKEDTQDEDAARALCEDEEVKKIGPEVKLCEYFKPKSDDGPPVVDRSGDTFTADVHPGKRDGQVRDAWVRGLGNLSQGLANMLSPQFTNPYGVNPYYFANNQYNSGWGLLSPSDKALYQARYFGGYGLYYPTLGTTPYTAFPKAPVSAYSTLGSNRSPYFTTY